ncbi:L-serine ammonia-lyase [Vibrio sp.]|nr:L-serine ammonia-lyase [Vibrio sp.]
MLSIFDIYKVGVGPSSSHTNGPMIAGYNFSESIKSEIETIIHVQVDLYGSLSLTGHGHHTDRAIILGLIGNKPDTINVESAKIDLHKAVEYNKLSLSGLKEIHFDYDKDIIFHSESLPLHENGMRISAFNAAGDRIGFETYYSTGGGFISTEDELLLGKKESDIKVTYPFSNAEEMLEQANDHNINLADMILQNEYSFQDREATDNKAIQIWDVMSKCMKKGFETEGVLEGGLFVTRRAPTLLKKLEANGNTTVDPLDIMDWVNLFAFSVSEENAAGGQVVTSPTNGAAGVIPAVLMYYNKFVKELTLKDIKKFLAVSGAVGALYKTNASISGAEVGCQGEIGVSSSMAAAGLACLSGGSNEQICIAAEIAMEHSLGMTCDPIGGLVQVPCIERNAMGAMKAINASRMSMKRSHNCLISLDEVIETMFRTGKDMNQKYRETSQGGLALIHIAPPCE